jgi:Flp pilus assembly protein TadG
VSRLPRPAAAACRGAAAALAHDCRGISALEFALIAVPLFMFLFGIIETGRMLWFQNALTYAVEEAARCASINSSICGSTTAIQAYAANRSSVLFPPSIFVPSAQTCGNQVTASYATSLAIPLVPLRVTLSATACYPS